MRTPWIAPAPHEGRRHRRFVVLTLLAAAMVVGLGGRTAAWAQQVPPTGPDATRPAPPLPPAPPSARDGEEGDDRTGDEPGGPGAGQGGGTERGVIEPPATPTDPAFEAEVPAPQPGTTRVIPPPGTPGGDPSIQPR